MGKTVNYQTGMSPTTSPTFPSTSMPNQPQENNRVFIVGASTRQAAAALARLEIPCVSLDLYHDRDTIALCQGHAHQLERFEDIRNFENDIRASRGVLFTGGLEGAQSIAVEISQWTDRLFTDPDALERMTKAPAINAVLSNCDMDRYPFAPTEDFPADEIVVVKKPYRSGSAKKSTPPKISDPNYLAQRWIEGDSISVVYCGSGAKSELLGASQQWVQRLECNCHWLTWCGSVGGLELSESDALRAQRFGDGLVEAFGLSGLFGVDFVRNEAGIWPVDINPRMPASMDIIGPDLMARHLNGFGFQQKPSSLKFAYENGVRGKAVLFNRFECNIEFPEAILAAWPMEHEVSVTESSIADVPPKGGFIRPYAPVVTTYAFGQSAAEVNQKLLEQLQGLNKIID